MAEIEFDPEGKTRVSWVPQIPTPEGLPTVLHGFKHVEPIDPARVRWATPAEQEAFNWGLAEGRRQATEGWERKWAIDSPKFIAPRLMGSEDAARGEGERWPALRVVSRLVGPWEPAPIATESEGAGQ